MVVLDWPAEYCYHHQNCKPNWKDILPAYLFWLMQQQMDHQRFLARQSRPGLPQLHKILRPRSELSCGFRLRLGLTFFGTQNRAEHPLARNHHFERSERGSMGPTWHMLFVYYPDSQQIFYRQRDPSFRIIFRFASQKSQGTQA
jgi:hypothetical protein